MPDALLHVLSSFLFDCVGNLNFVNIDFKSVLVVAHVECFADLSKMVDGLPSHHHQEATNACLNHHNCGNILMPLLFLNVNLGFRRFFRDNLLCWLLRWHYATFCCLTLRFLSWHFLFSFPDKFNLRFHVFLLEVDFLTSIAHGLRLLELIRIQVKLYESWWCLFVGVTVFAEIVAMLAHILRVLVERVGFARDAVI